MEDIQARDDGNFLRDPGTLASNTGMKFEMQEVKD